MMRRVVLETGSPLITLIAFAIFIALVVGVIIYVQWRGRNGHYEQIGKSILEDGQP